MQRAVEHGRIPVSSARQVRGPRRSPRSEVRPLPPAVVERMRAALGPQDAVLVSVLAYAGLRPGEALGLRWGDVRERTLLVNAPKTNSTRTVRLLGPLAQDLAEWRMRSGRPGDKTLVFPRPDGAVWQDHDWRNWRKRRFTIGLEAAGVDHAARPYDLRHSFASLLLAEGQSVHAVARQLGHAPSMTLDTYGHVIDELDGHGRIDAEAEIRVAREAQVPRSYLSGS
jgi:integrase